ncbi:hypothetical protein LINPERHAP1_LOCUS24083 [Linum perenne]
MVTLSLNTLNLFSLHCYSQHTKFPAIFPSVFPFPSCSSSSPFFHIACESSRFQVGNSEFAMAELKPRGFTEICCFVDSIYDTGNNIIETLPSYNFPSSSSSFPPFLRNCRPEIVSNDSIYDTGNDIIEFPHSYGLGFTRMGSRLAKPPAEPPTAYS